LPLLDKEKVAERVKELEALIVQYTAALHDAKGRVKELKANIHGLKCARHELRRLIDGN